MILFSRPGKTWNLGVGHGKSWKMTFIVQNKWSRQFFLQNKTQSNGNQDNFLENFHENGQINLRSWKPFKSHGKGHWKLWKSWNFKSPKGYKPYLKLLILQKKKCLATQNIIFQPCYSPVACWKIELDWHTLPFPLGIIT